MAYLKFHPANKNPQLPSGLKSTWIAGPDTLDSAQQQIVIKQGTSEADNQHIRVVVLSYDDNRVSMAFVKYTNGVAGPVIEKTGARYPYAIWFDPKTGVVTIAGQSNDQVTVTLDELGIS